MLPLCAQANRPLALGVVTCFWIQSIVGVPYFAVSLALNIFLTTAIVCRLLECRRETRSVLGKQHGKHYSFLTILFIESALMNVICSIFLLLSSVQINLSRFTNYSGRESFDDVFQAFLAVTPAIQVCSFIVSWFAIFWYGSYHQACSNYLIIYRGSKGLHSSWTDAVSVQPQTTLTFFHTDSIEDGTSSSLSLPRWELISATGPNNTPKCIPQIPLPFWDDFFW